MTGTLTWEGDPERANGISDAMGEAIKSVYGERGLGGSITLQTNGLAKVQYTLPDSGLKKLEKSAPKATPGMTTNIASLGSLLKGEDVFSDTGL